MRSFGFSLQKSLPSNIKFFISSQKTVNISQIFKDVTNNIDIDKKIVEKKINFQQIISQLNNFHKNEILKDLTKDLESKIDQYFKYKLKDLNSQVDQQDLAFFINYLLKQQKNLELSQDILKFIEYHNLSIETQSLNRLLKNFAQKRLTLQLLKTYQIIQEKDVQSYQIMVNFYIKNDLFDIALAYYQTMRDFGLLGKDNSEKVAKLILNKAIQLNLIDQINEILSDIHNNKEKNLHLNLILLEYYYLNDYIKEANALLSWFEKQSNSLKIKSENIYILYLIQQQQIGKAEEIIQNLQKKSYLDLKIYSKLIDHYSLNKDLNACLSIYNKVKQQDYYDIILLENQIIQAYNYNKKLNLALDFFYKMNHIDDVTINNIVDVIGRLGNIYQLRSAIDFMEKHRFTENNYFSIIEAFSKQRGHQEAIHYCQELLKNVKTLRNPKKLYKVLQINLSDPDQNRLYQTIIDQIQNKYLINVQS